MFLLKNIYSLKLGAKQSESSELITPPLTVKTVLLITANNIFKMLRYFSLFFLQFSFIPTILFHYGYPTDIFTIL